MLSRELCAHGSLDELISPARRGGRPLPERMTLNIAGELLGGLHHMHERNILHRDVKPANIFLTEGDTVGFYRCCSFIATRFLKDVEIRRVTDTLDACRSK
jgi:serine/threonine protein kinase